MPFLKRFKEKKYLIFLVFFLLFFVLNINHVNAATTVNTFGKDMLDSMALTAGLSTHSIYAIIGTILKTILALFGLIAVSIVVYGGVLWTLSKGDPEKINKAKKLMINAAIGMLIIASSYAIASFFVGKLTGIFGGNGTEYNYGEDPGTTGSFGSGFNVVSTYPRNEMENVKTCTRVSALFNRNLFADSVNDSSVYIRDEDNNKFYDSAKDNYYVADNLFTFYHNNHDFLKDKIYWVTVNSGADGVKSLSGELLERAKSIWFRTSQLDDYYPRVKQTYPDLNSNGACRNTFVQFEFQEGSDPTNLAEMDPTTFNTNNVTVEKCTGSNFGALTCSAQTGLEISSISANSIFSGFTVRFNKILDANSFYRVVLKSSDNDPTTNPDDGIANNCGKPLDGNANNTPDGATTDKYALYFKTGETENCEPTITNVSPNNGYYNDKFTVTGQYFGIFGDVSIAGFKADDNCTDNVDVDIYSVNDEKSCYVSWSDTSIETKIPFGSVTGALKVELASDVFASSAQDFSVYSPYISKLDPDHGPAGEFVRISGLNFGEDAGKVYFVSTTGDVTEAVSPAACSSTDTWRNNEIIIETPSVTAGQYAVIVGTPKDGGGYYYSNYLVYTVTTGTPGPGLCAVEPNQASRGTSVDLVGIRFGIGADTDKVIFSNVDISKATTSSWADKLIKVSVPNTAIDGYVSVYANSKESNKIYFNVLSITPESQTYPTVVDSPGCSSDSRSPSAYKNATDACINALVEARFNIDMDTSTFANNFELYGCEGEGTNCNTQIAGTITNIGARRIAFRPTSNLTAGTWYKALIKTGVQSLGTGKNLQNEYTWNFQTRTTNSGMCDINLINVLPTSATLNINTTTDLTANPSSTSDTCAVLKTLTTPTYVWASDDSNKVSVGTTSVNSTTNVGTANILGKAQTSLTKVNATWNLLTDYSDITVVDSGFPVVVDSPGCSSDSRSPSAYKNATDACINALVEARFNIDMDTSTFANNFELYGCEGEGTNCNTQIAGTITNIGARRIAFRPTSNLTAGTWYKALIKTGVQSLGTGKNLQNEYTWNFQTRTANSGMCDINLINVLPTSATLNINTTTDLTANPSSTSDTCATLVANSPSYNWTTENSSKVEITATSINSSTTVGSATVKGIAEVLSNDVTARYKNTSITDYSDIRVDGEGSVGSSCNNSNDCLSGLCCGSDNICTANFSICPPRVDEQSSCHAESSLIADVLSNPSPYKGKTDACPNISVNISFDLDMKSDQGTNAINNLANFIVEDCGASNSSCSQLTLQTSQIEVLNSKTLIWTPASNLKQNNYYRISVYSTVQNVNDVNLESNYIFTFKTRGENCNITRIDANPGTLSLQNEYEPNGDLSPAAQSSSGLCQSIIIPSGTTYSWKTNDSNKVGICSGANYTSCTSSTATTENVSIKAKAAVVNNLVDVTITLPADSGVFSSKDNTPQTSLVSVATCSDGVKNWNETSIDSGGVCLVTTYPTNGQCGVYNSTYSSSSQITTPCTAGDLDGSITYNSSLNKFEWSCRGLNSGTTASCSANGVPNTNGQCGNNTGNYSTDTGITACAAGVLDSNHPITFNNVSGKWEWRCLGLGSGIGVDCTANGPTSGSDTPINGACGSNTGNYSNQSSIPTPCSTGDTGDITFNLVWKWDCSGLYGGTIASCTANGPLVNNCGNSVCDTGLGENHENCPADCAATLSCDNDDVLDSGEVCDRDQLSGKTCADFTNGEGHNYNSGSLACDTDCNYYIGFCTIENDTSINGACNTSYTGNYTSDSQISTPCSYGNLTTPPGIQFEPVTNNNKWEWTCGGLNGGSNSSTCSANGPVSSASTNAVCATYAGNNSTNSSILDTPCTTGDYYTAGGVILNTSTNNWEWRCNGLNGGSNANCTALGPSSGTDTPVNGSCGTNNATNYENTGSLTPCAAGTEGTITLNTTTNKWTWTCSGLYSGTNASCNANGPSSSSTTPVNGVCKIPPHSMTYTDSIDFSDHSADRCSYGLASSVSGSGPWTWNCAGVDGGTQSSCSSYKQTVQECNENSVMDGDETGIDCGGSLCPSCSLTTDCGNGIKNTGEACDINDFGSSTCSTFGFNSGNLSCSSECEVVTSACYNNNSSTAVNGVCKIPPHNNQYSTFSVSDFPSGICSYGLSSSVSGTGPWTWTCSGLNSGSNASCSATKGSSSSVCNENSVMDGDETGIDCGGSLCPSCSLTTDCGNGIKNTGEACDINDFGSSTCSTFGFNSGNLSCSSECEVVTSACYNNNSSTAVNGVCKIPPHNNQYSTFSVSDFPSGICSYGLSSSVSGTGPWTWTCSGLNSGSNASCSATKANLCGNGTKNIGEDCDTNDFGVSTCATFGFNSGNLICTGVCTINTTACYTYSSAVNGVCNTSYTGNYTSDSQIATPCSYGNLTTPPGIQFEPVTNNNKWEWTCGGLNGGSNSSTCSANGPVSSASTNAVCATHSGNNSTNSSILDTPCTTGDYYTAGGVILNTSTNNWEWRCNGLNGGSNANCTALGPSSGTDTPVNGSCGTNNATNYENTGSLTPCTAGTEGTITLNTTTNKWTWTCSGLYSGTNASCNANGPSSSSTTPVNGVCKVPPHNNQYSTFSVGDFPSGICSYGLASSVSGSGPWTWNCAGVNGGSTPNCIANKITLAAPTCGSTINNGPYITLTNTSPNLCGYGSTLSGNVNVSGDNNSFNWTCVNGDNVSKACYVAKNNCGNGIIDTGELCDTNTINGTGDIYHTDYNTPKKACEKVYGEGNYSVLGYGYGELYCSTDCVLDLTKTCTPTSSYTEACTSNKSKVTILNTSFSSSSDVTSNFIQVAGISNWSVVSVDNTTNKAMQYSASDTSLLLYKNKLDFENYTARGYFRINSNKKFGFLLNRDSSGEKYYKVELDGSNGVTLYKDGSYAAAGTTTNNLFVEGSLKWYYFELIFNSDKNDPNIANIQLKVSKNGLNNVGDSVQSMTTVLNYSDSSKNARGFFGVYSNGAGNILFDNFNVESSDNIYEYNNSLYNFGFFYCKDDKDVLNNLTDTVTATDKECGSGTYKCIDRSCRSSCTGYGGYSGVYVVSGSSDNYKNSARVFIDSNNKPVMVFRVWSVPRVGDTYKNYGPFIDFDTWISRLNIGGTYTPAQRVGMRDDYIIYKQGNSYYFWSSNIDTAQTKGEIYVYVLTYQEGGDETLFNEIISNTKFNTNL